jgi:transcriptional regulator with XRE-family HTH domain
MRALGATQSKEDFWRQHWVRWQKSGLTQREYCARQGLSRSSFNNWKQKLASEESVGLIPTSAGQLQVVEVGHVAAAAGPSLTLALGNGYYRVEIGRGLDLETLASVLDVLEARV